MDKSSYNYEVPKNEKKYTKEDGAENWKAIVTIDPSKQFWIALPQTSFTEISFNLF